jgi:hypothetical protein
MANEELRTYRVRPGFRHGAFDQYGPGDEVQLTALEAAGFLDKLEEVAASPVAEPKSEPVAEPEPAPKGKKG